MTMFGPHLTPADTFRQRADQCRRLASQIGDSEVARLLRELARDNDQRAFYAHIAEEQGRKDLS